jgi:hypothetical protein
MKLREIICEFEVPDQEQVRKQLSSWMGQDQANNEDPTQRAGFQGRIWPYIKRNIKTILADRGEDGKGSFPAAPFAAWLLVQHMDAYPDNQVEFLNWLEQSGLDPTDGKGGPGKLQYLRDRSAVNQWILRHALDRRYYYKGRPLPNPTVNVRNPEYFADAGSGSQAANRHEALQNARKAGNRLLVAAVLKTGAKTQPSFRSN